jgi:hypothetical protein
LGELSAHFFPPQKNIKNIINGCIRSHAPNMEGCEAEMSEIFAAAEGGVQYSITFPDQHAATVRNHTNNMFPTSPLMYSGSSDTSSFSAPGVEVVARPAPAVTEAGVRDFVNSGGEATSGALLKIPFCRQN